MLSKTHKLTEALTTAIGPVLRENPDYNIIQQAMGLVLARIAQSTPEVGHEFDELEVIHEYAKQALTEFLRIESEKAILDKGIDGFAEMFTADPALGLVAINGGMGAKTQAAAEEAQDAATEKDLQDYYQDRITLEDMAARKERRRIQAEEAEQARLDTFKED